MASCAGWLDTVYALKSIIRQRGEERTQIEEQKGTVGEVAPEFQELGSKRQDKRPEAIKLKQSVLPTVRDRKLKGRHCAEPGSYVQERKQHKHKGTACILHS